MITVTYPQELEGVLAHAVAMARVLLIEHKRLEELQRLDKVIELYKHNKNYGNQNEDEKCTI